MPPLRTVLLVLLFSSSAAAQIVPVVMTGGLAAPGQLDPNVTYLLGPATSSFVAPFTAADFQAARTGPQAVVRAGLAGGWPPQLPLASTAQWIDTQPGNTSALYAIPFTLNVWVPSAVLLLQFAADDRLGDAPATPGVYINEMPVELTEGIGGYYFVETIHRPVDSQVQQGQNWLYLYLRNTGGPGALMFHAEVQILGGMVRTFGSGCAGSAGTPQLDVSATSTQPGATVLLNLSALPPGAPVAMVFGVDNTMAFGFPTPVDLGFLGYAGCSALLDPLALTVILSAGGTSQFPAVLPGAGYIGFSIFCQGFVLDPAHSRGASITNAVELRGGF